MAAALLGLAGILVRPVLVAVAVLGVVATIRHIERPAPERPWRGPGVDAAATDEGN